MDRYPQGTTSTIQKSITKDADKISTATVVDMLIKKKIFTIEELMENENQFRGELSRSKDEIKFVNIEGNLANSSNYSGLKAMMRKRKWTRALGSKLFGWKWRKIKKAP